MVSCADVTTVAYSDRASGVYVSTEMFGKLGITEAMKDKAKKISATPVGEIVKSGMGPTAAGTTNQRPGIAQRYCSPSFETATSRPPQDEVQLVEPQQPHAEERASRASRSMGSKRLTRVRHHLCIPCCIASSTTTASARTIVVHFQNSSGLRSISGVEDVER
jgi:hypothetical protein